MAPACCMHSASFTNHEFVSVLFITGSTSTTAQARNIKLTYLRVADLDRWTVTVTSRFKFKFKFCQCLLVVVVILEFTFNAGPSPGRPGPHSELPD